MSVTEDPTRDPWKSPHDDRLSLPGEERLALVNTCARELAGGGDWYSGSWPQLADLDTSQGFGTRFAVRGVLRRPSDGRYLLFRYPFADGSMRWVIPGGGADPGETIDQTLRR